MTPDCGRITPANVPCQPGSLAHRARPIRRHGSGVRIVAPADHALRCWHLRAYARGPSTLMSSYHQGQRKMQDAFDSRRIADRLEEVTYRSVLSPGDREQIEAAD